MLANCASCGGLLASGRRCCPHCHCKTSAWRHIVFVLAAGLGLAKVGCSATPVYGGVVYGLPDASGIKSPADAGSDGGQDMR